MAQDHHVQPQRFELKYLIEEAMTGPIRDFLSCHLELDDFSRVCPGNAYDIHSVYLDSAHLHTYRATFNGEKNRFKLRYRYYDDHPASPVFFEIKQRVDNCILKQRCPVRREAVPLLVAGEVPGAEHTHSNEFRHFAALRRFHLLQQHLKASPRLHNHFFREAWVAPEGNAIRVTFDRRVHVEPYFGDQPVIAMTRPQHIYSEHVILELKFTDRFPDWCRDMVEHFQLVRRSAMKYCGGVESLGQDYFQGFRHKETYAAQTGVRTDW